MNRVLISCSFFITWSRFKAIFYWAERHFLVFWRSLFASSSLNKRKCRSARKITPSGKWPLVLGGIYEWNIVLVLPCGIGHRDLVRRMVRSWIVFSFQLRKGQCGGSHKGDGYEDPKFAACVFLLLLLSCWFLRCTVFCSHRRLRDKWCLCMNSPFHFWLWMFLDNCWKLLDLFLQVQCRSSMFWVCSDGLFTPWCFCFWVVLSSNLALVDNFF